jgi:hypothetical protein
VPRDLVQDRRQKPLFLVATQEGRSFFAGRAEHGAFILPLGHVIVVTSVARRSGPFGGDELLVSGEGRFGGVVVAKQAVAVFELATGGIGVAQREPP